METRPAVDPGPSYLLRRLAVHLGARENVLAALIGVGARADGWLAVEAFNALSGPLAARRVRGLRLRGVSQAEHGDQPDLELEVDGGPLSLRLLSLPVVGLGAAAIAAPDGELARHLRLASQRGAGAVLAVLYPLRPDDAAWREGIPELERASGTRMLDQVPVLLPGPDRLTVSLWRPRT